MKQNFTRRDFLSLAAGTAVSLVALGKAFAQPAQDKRVVVIGGGFAGATCAKYLRRADPAIQVTLIERQRNYVTPPSSNLVATGLRPLSAITLGYDKLSRNHGIQMVFGNAVSIDPAAKNGRPGEWEDHPLRQAGGRAGHRLQVLRPRGLQ